MDRIEFNDTHKSVIEKQLNGEYNPFFASDEEQKAFNEVIEIAENHLDNFSEDYDFGGDMIQWIWDQYQAQESEA